MTKVKGLYLYCVLMVWYGQRVAVTSRDGQAARSRGQFGGCCFGLGGLLLLMVMLIERAVVPMVGAGSLRRDLISLGKSIQPNRMIKQRPLT